MSVHVGVCHGPGMGWEKWIVRVSRERGGLWLDSQRQVFNSTTPRRCPAHTNTLLQQRDKVMIIAQRILSLERTSGVGLPVGGKGQDMREARHIPGAFSTFGVQILGFWAPDSGWCYSWSHLYASVAESSKQQHTEAHSSPEGSTLTKGKYWPFFHLHHYGS